MTPLDYYENVEKKSKDHVATPRWVVTQMYELINISQFRNVWFPFNNYDSEFKLKADELNLEYKATHLFNDLRQDFFTTEPPKDCELLISNPPFSLQNQIIKRTFDLADSGKIKAFALLLPLSTLETPFRADLWQRHQNDRFTADDCLDSDCVVIRYANSNVEKIDRQTYMIRYITDDLFRDWFGTDQWKLF